MTSSTLILLVILPNVLALEQMLQIMHVDPTNWLSYMTLDARSMETCYMKFIQELKANNTLGAASMRFEEDSKTCDVGKMKAFPKNLGIKQEATSDAPTIKVYTAAEAIPSNPVTHVMLLYYYHPIDISMDPINSPPITYPVEWENPNRHGSSMAVPYRDGVLYCGNDDEFGITDICLLFVHGETNTSFPSLPEPRGYGGMVLHRGQPWIIGGYLTSEWDMTTSTVIFDPNLNAWVPGPSLPQSPAEVCAAVIDDVGDQVLIAGGKVWDNPTATWYEQTEMTFIYDWNDNSYTFAGNLSNAVEDHRCVRARLDNGKDVVIVAGGQRNDSGHLPVANIDIFDIKTRTWSPGPPFPVPRHGGMFVVVDNVPLYFGGEGPIGITTMTDVLEFKLDGTGWIDRTQDLNYNSLINWGVAVPYVPWI